jgi:excisionase family DNA binding protein
MGICEGLLTLKEAASLLRIHPKTLQNMAIRGEVPSIKILRGWRFRESDLQRWINSLVRLPHNSSSNGGPIATHITNSRHGTPGWPERMRYGQR